MIEQVKVARVNKKFFLGERRAREQQVPSSELVHQC